MATPTYVPLATYTVTGSPDSIVEFSSIPATYRDLVLVYNGTTSGSGGNFTGTINNDTGANYSFVSMYAQGASVGSGAGSASVFYGNLSSLDSTIRYTQTFQFMDYSATDKHKTIIHRGNASASNVYSYAFRWANTAAINTIKLVAGTTSFAVGSTFSLFGIH